ncbi:MAG: hypothetical protein WC813_03450 [Patescibacteria group bacterium]|jgi:hypothetical protein
MANFGIGSAYPQRGVASQAGSGNVPSLNDFQTLRADLVAKIDDYDKRADERQIRSIEALGVFVALFTFVSVSIQIFGRIADAWSAGLFIVLIFCAMTLFILVMDLVLIKKIEGLSDVRMILFCVLILLGIGSVCLLRFAPLNPPPESIEFQRLLDQRIESRLEDSNNEYIYTRDQVDVMLKREIPLQCRDACLEVTPDLRTTPIK